MEIQSSTSSNPSRTAPTLATGRGKSDLLLFLTLFFSALCLVYLLDMAAISIGFGLILAIFGVLIVLALVVAWPMVGFFVALGCTLLIEQNPLPLLGNNANIYVFAWPPTLQGLPDRPIGFFMLFVLLIVIIHGLLKRQTLLQGGALLLPFLFLLLCVVWGIVHGLGTGGDLKITVNEVRSFWYLFVGYLLAYNLITSKKHLYAFFWFVIICAGIKALEGVYIYAFIIKGDLAANHEIMSHEESYFWVSILLLIMLFSLHHKYRPQFYAAVLLIPFLLISLVANNRRADFVALLAGLIVAWVLMFVINPKARKSLVVFLIATLLIGGAYIAAF